MSEGWAWEPEVARLWETFCAAGENLSDQRLFRSKLCQYFVWVLSSGAVSQEMELRKTSVRYSEPAL